MQLTTDQGRRTDPQHLTPETCLTVDSVTFRYPRFELAPASFQARAGELVAILGPNGSGKSTLLAILSGYLKPISGRVELDGANLHSLAARDRARRVGLARQSAPLPFSFEVREFVRQGRHPHLNSSLFESAEDERWVDWAMARTHLTTLAGRRVTAISDGEFQRVILARALAQRPRLVLLDEPTANLDIGYQIEMLRLLRDLAASEAFVAVIVTHELNLAAELAHQVILLDRGRSIAQGTPEQVFEPELLRRVFHTPVIVDRNPSSGRPRVTWAGVGS